MRISLKPFWRREAGSAADGESAQVGAGAVRWLRPARRAGAPADAAAQWPDTEPHADTENAQANYQSALQTLAQRPGEPVALSIRLPFCAARCLFCDRDILAAQPSDVIGSYAEALADEVALLAQHIGRDRDVLQLHLGGGTANELSDSQLAGLVEALQTAWRLPSDAEMSAECDPRRVTRQHLEMLRGLGFRHVTFGVADFDITVQQAIGRRNSQALIDDVCVTAREVGFERIQLELIVGLPHQSASGWRSTLDRLIAMAPDRVALSCYQHRPDQAPAQHAIDSAALPDGALCTELRSMTSTAMLSAGYAPIGASQFVLDDDELALARPEGRLRRNLIGYTATPAVPLLGLGAGGVGEIDGSMFWNHAALPAWHAALREKQLPVARARLACAEASRLINEVSGGKSRWLS